MNECRFPLFIDLRGKRITVYGGGTIATRRVATLVDFGPAITVVAPQICDAMLQLGVTCKEEAFCPHALPPSDFVLAATSDAAVNHEIAMLCKDQGIPVNNASCQDDCDFHFPAIARSGSLVVGINAAGTDHGLVKRVAAQIRTELENLT